MKLAVTSLDNKGAGEIELADEIFALPVRKDILARMVNYQLAKRRAGTHKAKQIGDIQGTTKETVEAERHGPRAPGQPAFPAVPRRRRDFRPGGAQPRQFSLQKKVRRLALKTALSAKHAEGKLVVLEAARAGRAARPRRWRCSSRSSAGNRC